MPSVREPLVPADVDLRDFAFMPLEIERLRKSKAWLVCKRKPELAFYMLNLWCACWHERPAGSLDDDDDLLADRAMCPPERWPALKEEVLRGFVKCADGRLYHPIVCEKVRDAWGAKQDWRQRTSAARSALAQQRLSQRQAQSPSQSLPLTLSPARPHSQLNGSTGPVAIHKGEGEREGDSESPQPPVVRGAARSSKSPKRARHDASRDAWIQAEIIRKRGGSLETLQKAHPLIAEAIRLLGGFNAIGMQRTDQMGRMRARFREIYETLLQQRPT